MISKSLQQWVDAAAALRKPRVEVVALLRDRGYSESVIQEALAHYGDQNQFDKFIDGFLSVYSVLAILVISGIITLFINDVIPFFILVVYTIFMSASIAPLIKMLFSEFKIVSLLVVTFSMLLVSKFTSHLFDTQFIGSLVIFVIAGFGISLIIYRGGISKDNLSVVFLSIGLFVLDRLLVFLISKIAPIAYLVML